MARKIVLFAYIFGMVLLVSLPLNEAGSDFLTNTYVVKIRLDYLGHIILFIPFLMLVKISYPLPFLGMLLAGMVFAGFCEGVQYLLPYRSFNINDLLANMLGILVGIILILPPVLVLLQRKAEGALRQAQGPRTSGRKKD